MLILRIGSDQTLFGIEQRSLFHRAGMLCEQTQSLHEATEFLRTYDYNIVLLDQFLRDGPCHEVVRKLRAAGCSVPIVVLGDSATPRMKALSLDQGADDYITLPCAPEEVLARIRAVVRRSTGHAGSILRAGRAEFTLDQRQVRVGGKSLALSKREFMVLELLFLKQGCTVTKTALFNHLYCGQDEREMKTLDVIVCRLRKKLMAAGMPPLIETVWGFGYTLRVENATTVDPIPSALPATAVAPRNSAQILVMATV
ncbi:MAG: hypothetical protein B7Z80_24910 [Rhodospirillales bacterium 20-64-7]|nr:MAG: hypothetical protein B7Z80_24910 [Rhodospirillales bacterium 20-64-7]HQT78834.1 response regulator transcription factor [Rhodopila sp.]